MPQLNFALNGFVFTPPTFATVNNGSLSFIPFSPTGSISFLTMNVPHLLTNSNMTFTMSFGLYSLTDSSLSLINSISGTHSGAVASKRYASLTATSAAQNISPGTWFFGLLYSTGGVSNLRVYGGLASAIGANAFPGGFIGGAMTDSTSALPSLIATSDLNITGTGSIIEAQIILSA